MDRSGRTGTDAEAIDEITGSGIGNSDQKVCVVKGPRQVSFEALEGRRRHRIRHGRESEVMNGRHLCLPKGFLVSVKEEVGRKDNLIAVQDPQEGLDDVSQQEQSRSDGQQKTGWYLVDAKPHGAVSRHLRRRWIVRGEKGAGVKVVGDSVVTTVKGGEKVPLVPSDTCHAFEKRIDIDPDSGLLTVVDDAGMEASPTGAQGASQVAGDIDEETGCGRKAVEHGGQSYRSWNVGVGPADRYRYRNRYRYRKT